MPDLRGAATVALTLAAATASAFLFHAARLPLAYILGALVGAALVANLHRPMRGGRRLRRCSQVFVGASVGVLLSPAVLNSLVDLFPLMLAIALLANAAGALLAVPIAALAGIDRLTALLSTLPAGMAEMATLAREVDADEQSVAIIHTLRVVIVLTFVPLWLLATGHPPGGPRPEPAPTWGDAAILAGVVAASFALAWAATRARVINAYIIAPMLVSVAVVAAGGAVPGVPQPLLVAAQIGIGTSLGLRFRADRMRRLPRTVLGALVSGALLTAVSFFGFGAIIERLARLDHLSALLSAAPGGLGEMIATANALGIAAAAVAGFQITRSVFTNLLVAPLIRWAVQRNASK